MNPNIMLLAKLANNEFYFEPKIKLKSDYSWLIY